MKPCRFKQLCAIAKACLEQDPTLLTKSVEWKERIKDRVVGLGYPSPLTEHVWAAMDAVEHVHRKGAR